MSGNPDLFRAKRAKYFHVEHTSTFDGNETQHVKGNFNASIDGNYKLKAKNASIDAPLDLMGHQLLNPRNVLRTIKRTVVAADLTETASQDIAIFRASPGDTIYNQFAKIITSMGQPATPTSRTRMKVGDLADTGGFGVTLAATPVGWKWTTETYVEKGDYFYNASRARAQKTYTTATMVNVRFVASDIFLASIVTGEIEFYVDVMSRA